MNDQQPKRFYILSPFCLLRPTTNRIFDMRMCDALAGNGAEVEIIYPYVWMKDNIRRSEIPSSYAVENSFRATMQFTPLWENTPAILAFIIMMMASTITALRIVLVQLFSRQPAVVWTRDSKSLYPVLLLKKIFGKSLRLTIIFAAAEVTKRKMFRYAISNSDGVFAGVTTTREAIRKVVNIPDEKFMLSLAPVPEYKNDCSREEARKKINYTSEKPLIVYTGKLGLDVNELKYILQAAALVPEAEFIFTGGRASAVEAVKKYCAEVGATNCHFTGFFNESSAVRNYQLAADILVSYYTAKDHMIEFNYPQKVNEYMSTGNVIITPDFPATQDVLNSNNVFFVQPDSPEALANGLKHLLQNADLRTQLAQQALKDIQPLSFKSKTRELMEFASKLGEGN